jgi:hypothetical protein
MQVGPDRQRVIVSACKTAKTNIGGTLLKLNNRRTARLMTWTRAMAATR